MNRIRNSRIFDLSALANARIGGSKFLFLSIAAACCLPTQSVHASPCGIFKKKGWHIDHDRCVPRTFKNQEEQVIVTGQRSRSEQSIGKTQIQRLLPGINPLQALNVLPGVIYNDADPWGNTERSASLFVHGFNQQQLGYTLDGVPLGDQIYGNDNGLTPTRAAISENVSIASIATGAGALGTASTSNLGGTLQFQTSDPMHHSGGQIGQTFGSFSTFRTYARFDTGDFNIGKMSGNSAFFSWARQDARAWDSGGHQGGNQVNFKLIHNSGNDKIVYFFDWSDKVDASADGIILPEGKGLYKRPFTYPNLAYAQSYAKSPEFRAAGLNFRDYYTSAKTQDFLTYLSWNHRFSDRLNWNTQVYYHHNLGQLAVSGPINIRGVLPVLESYFPGQSPVQINDIFGGSGYETRATQYWDNRGGIQTSLNWRLGHHSIDLGGWYERNNDTQARRWFPVNANNPSTPYQWQKNAAIDQFTNSFYTNTFVTHLQDTWRITHNLSLNAGFKSELVYTNGILPVAALPASLSPKGSITAPGGEIDAVKPFLPAFGAVWNITRHEQWFANVQENMRSYLTSGYGTASPWGVTSQKAFQSFKDTGKPESAWVYETGLRTHGREINLGILTGISGQIEYYHVHYSNRLIAVKSTPNISSIVGSANILTNVGSVDTDGMDLSITAQFGQHFSLYNALSYNKSIYNQNYGSGNEIIHTAGRNVAGNPAWAEKFVASTFWGPFYAQMTANVIGKRYATFTNDMSISPYAQFDLNAGYTIHSIPHIAALRFQGNITNLTNEKAWSTVLPTAAMGQTTVFPIAPRMFFFNVSANF
nr:TonB-dependent receptor [Gluconobacter sphaericus]